MRVTRILRLASLAAALTACSGESGGGKLNETQAERLADDMVKTWESGDAARIKALYAPIFVGYDSGSPEMTTDKGSWDKLQDAYAAAHFDKIDVSKRRIQILDGDTFVVTHEGTDAQSSHPEKTIPFRCTEVFHRSDSQWLIVNENCSMPPKD